METKEGEDAEFIIQFACCLKLILARLMSQSSGKSQKSWFRQLHGGEIKVVTKQGKGAEVIIQLPVI